MNADALCAKGDATLANGVWTCGGCGKTFERSPNQHIYAARKRLAKAVKALHCLSCFDVVRNGPKQEPCGCGCHR